MTRLGSVPRPWRYIVVISLAVNLAVLGVVVGSAFDRHGPGRGPKMGGPVAPLVMALPEESRDALRSAFRAARPPRGERDDRGRASFEALLSAIRAEPFAPEAVIAALNEQRQAGDARLGRLEAALAEELARLSSTERADYAERLSESIRRRR